MSIICNITTGSSNSIIDRTNINVIRSGSYTSLSNSPASDNTAFNIATSLRENNPLLGLTEWSFGTWVKNSYDDPYRANLFHFCNAAGYTSITLAVLSNSISLLSYTGTTQISASGTYTDWTHVEVGYDGTNVYLFIGGVLKGTTSPSLYNLANGAYNQFWFGEWSLGAQIFSGICYKPFISNKCLHTSSFTPLLDVNMYNLFIKGTEVWGVTDSFKKLADDWGLLTNSQKIAMFKSTNYATASASQLVTLGTFKALTYAENNSQPSCIVTALPNDQIVYPKELISTYTFENVDSITPTVTNNTSTAKVRFFLTNDLATYYVYNSGTKTFDTIDATNSATLLSNGMNVSDFSGIDVIALNTFVNKNTGIGIGFVLSSTTISDLTTVDNLAMQVDMKGSWNHAVYGTDVTYGYPNNNLLKVTLLTSGSYKINYNNLGVTT